MGEHGAAAVGSPAVDTVEQSSRESSPVHGESDPRADRSLVLRFAGAVLVALVVVGLLVSAIVERQVRDEHERFATFHAVFVRDSILAQVLAPLQRGQRLSGVMVGQLLRAIDDRVLDDHVRRVRVWGFDGTVLASDDRALIGRTFPEVVPHLEEVGDEPMSYVAGVTEPWQQGDIGLVEQAFVTMLPVGDAAILEVLQDYAPTAAAVTRFSHGLAISGVVGLVLIFLSVLPLAAGASRRLRRQADALAVQAAERGRSLEAEQASVRRLEELDDLKNTFLSAVSHELRTPLTVVRGVSSTLTEHDARLRPEQRADLLQRLDQQAVRLDRLLQDLLDVDHLTRRAIAPRRAPTDVAALVTHAVAHVESPTHEIEVMAEPVLAQLDGSQVERIVENLVANAVRHTPPGSHIAVDVRATDDGLHLTVVDDGPGIPADIRDHIFQPFAQGPITDGHSPGTGIGLALVARFARLHDGRAWVQDAPGGGAAFHVELRADTEASADAPTAEPAHVG